MSTRDGQGQELDAEDVHIGRAVITRGLVAPGDVLDALEAKAREAERGRAVSLGELLVRSGKITREALDPLRPLKGANPSKSVIAAVELARHVPTMKLVDGWWRETRDSPPRIGESSDAREAAASSGASRSSEVPVLHLTEHQATLEFTGEHGAEPREFEQAEHEATLALGGIEVPEGEQASPAPADEPSSEDELVIIDTLEPKARAAAAPHAAAPHAAAPHAASGRPKAASGVPRPGAKMGQWILEEELGRGGMGVIFRARHEKWGDLAAVKVLRDPTRRSLVDRFTRETESMRRLEHRNIVRILDKGQEGYCPWFAMELIVGKTLSLHIREKQLLPRQAVEILSLVSRAVHHAHELGVLHRDLKPANVLIANDGTVKVTDFGLAKLDDDDRSLTRAGAPVGTPAYMSPEQALGGGVDRRTDVFSLGVMLFEAVSGKLPWTPERLAKVYAGGEVTLPPMKRGDPRLEAIVLRATESRPEARFESAEAFARELDQWMVGSVPSSSRLSAKLARLKSAPRWLELVAAASFGGFIVSTLAVRANDAPRPVTVAAAAATPVAASPVAAPAAAAGSATATAPVRAPATSATTAPVASRGSAPAAAPAPAPSPAPPPAPGSAGEGEVAGASAPVDECVKKLLERTERPEVVALSASAPPAEPTAIEEARPEDAELLRVKAGRARFMKVVSTLQGIESFDEQALMLRAKRGGARIPVANMSVRFLSSQLATAEERSNVARYLRARGLNALAEALEK